MSLNYAILGILRCRPMTGYDLKKIIQDSPFMYWSGNNNQIYTTLIELSEEGLVTSETRQQENLPPKKIYTITPDGLEMLRKEAAANPLPPETKHPFWVQLAFADVLSDAELDKLLRDYEEEAGAALAMRREEHRRGAALEPGNPREAFLWEMVDDGVEAACRQELDWIRGVRARLADFRAKEGRKTRKAAENNEKGVPVKMNFQRLQNGEQRYIEVFSCEEPVATTKDALDLVAACGENDTNLLLLHAEALSDDFFKLRTGVAGEIFQKLINYTIRTAVLLPDSKNVGPSFRELMAEAARSRHYRFFTDRAEAEDWLLKGESSHA